MALDTNVAPYYDDFDEAKNFLRILFNPGRAVQARELTQAQTILHNQLKKHAGHVFKDGSPILGGEIKVNAQKVSVVVDALDSGAAPVDIAALDGLVLRKVDGGDLDTGDKALITHYDVATRTYLIDYIGGDFVAGDKLVVRNVGDTIIADVTVSTGGIGDAITATISDGLFYVDGSFVLVTEQTIAVDFTSNTTNQHIGLQMTDVVYTSGDDGTLVDPANGSFNFAAPGADRLRYGLTLASVVDGNAIPVDFYELMEINAGLVLYAVKGAQYGDLLDLLAKRTYDESGDYTVKPFEIFVSDDPLDNSNYQIKLDPGLAYIKGYEVKTESPLYLTADKPRTTRLSNNEKIYIDYGIYIDIDDTAGDDLVGMFEIDSREYVQLKSQADGAGQVISTCRILSISRSPLSALRIWLEWVPSLRDSLRSTKSILGVDSGAIANNIAFDASGQTDNVSLVYELEDGNVKDILLNETIITSVKSYQGVTVAGTAVLVADDNVSDFVGSGQNGIVVLLDDTGTPSTEFTYVTASVGGGLSTLTITPTGGLVGTATVDVVAKLERPTANAKTKTLTAHSYVFNSTGTSQNLQHYDVFRVTQVEVKEVGAADNTYAVTTGWSLINNDTDVSYEYDTLDGIVNTKTYRVTYQYFAHGGTGDFFAVNSYMTAGNLILEPNLYSLLGNYVSQDGTETYSLTDVIDFRRTPTDLLAANGVFTPEARGNVFIDYNYYLARHDKVVVSKEGKFSIVQGVPAAFPEPPESDSKGLVTLYNLQIPAYVKETKHMLVDENQLENYTMLDIRGLERRIGNLEYYSSLNLLEKQSDELNFVDENGLNKFKNGIVVDNFMNFDTSNIVDLEYRATIDDIDGILRCPFVDDAIEFTADATPAGMVIKDGQLMYDYTAAPWIEQALASGTTNLMPYDIVKWEGILKLTPSSDTWIDNVELPVIRTTIDNRDSAAVKAARRVTVWNSWQTRVVGRTIVGPTRYGGIQRNNEVAGRSTSRYPIRKIYVATVNTTTQSSRTGITVVPTDIMTRVTSDKEISRTAIPYMRAKSVVYTAKALRPKTNFNATFDDQDVTGLCTTLLSDSLGDLTGTFSLPAGTFTTGTKAFKLIDSDHGLSPLSEAGASYTAIGTLVKHQRTITSIRQTVYNTRAVSQTYNTTRKSTQIVATGGWYDPVAQSFRVDDQEGGVFVESVEVYFNLKSADIPVQAYLVTMDNGLPTTDIIPGSNVSVAAANVNISADSSVSTKFTFDAPLPLHNQTDYAFVMMANSKEYFMFHSELGETDLITGKRIISQPYLGSMFLSQNATTWTPVQTKDVKFKLNKCVFNTGTKVVALTNDHTLMTQDGWVSTMTPNFEMLEHDQTTSLVEYKFSSEAVYTPVTNKENVELSTRQILSTDGVTNVKYNITLTNTNTNVTPIIDTERLSSVIVYNDVIDIVNPTTEETNGGFLDAGTYITKSVQLADSADDLRVMFDAQLPAASRTKVFYKASTYVPKYLEVDAGSTVHDKFKNNTCYVYWYNSADGSWTEKSTVFVTKNDTDSAPDRVYISKVGDYTDFIATADFAANSITDLFISDHNIDDTITNIAVYAGGTTYAIGDYVFYLGELFVSNISSNLGNTPTDAGTAWELIETTSTTSIITEDPEAGWKAMKQQNVVDASVNVSTKFVEYTFIPDEYPEDDFKEFAVKVEMQSIDFTNIPLAQNFRAIALM